MSRAVLHLEGVTRSKAFIVTHLKVRDLEWSVLFVNLLLLYRVGEKITTILSDDDDNINNNSDNNNDDNFSDIDSNTN